MSYSWSWSQDLPLMWGSVEGISSPGAGCFVALNRLVQLGSCRGPSQQLVWQKSWLLGKCCSVQDGIAATLGSEAPEGAEEMRLAGCQLWAEALLVLSTASVCHENIQAVCLNSLLWASVHAQSCWCDGERGPWSHIRKCHLGGDTGVVLVQFSDVAGQFMPHREKKTVVQIWFSCCAWEKVVKDSLRWQCCVTVSCHSVSKRGLSVPFRTPQQTTVVLAQVLAVWKTGEWSNAFCVLEALLTLRSGLMVINTGAPERMGGKEEEEDEGNVYLSLPPTRGMAELLHNTTGNHLRSKISCSTLWKGWCSTSWCSTSVCLPEVVCVWNEANPEPEGLWEPEPVCCQFWMRWLLLLDLNSKLGLLDAPSFSITGVAWTLNVFGSYRCCTFPWLAQSEEARSCFNWKVLNSVQVFIHLNSEQCNLQTEITCLLHVAASFSKPHSSLNPDYWPEQLKPLSLCLLCAGCRSPVATSRLAVLAV